MNRRSHRWIAWLLPLLVARAFVPTGFMLSATSGELSLAFCPSAGPIAQVAVSGEGASHHAAQAHEHSHGDHGQHAHHAPGGGADQHSSHFGASDTGICPFAVVAAACSAADFYLANVRLHASPDLFPFYVAPPDANRPIRSDRIRGPPVLISHA